MTHREIHLTTQGDPPVHPLVYAQLARLRVVGGAGREDLIDVEEWAEIRRLHVAEGMGVRAIARRLGVARNTVRSALGYLCWNGKASTLPHR